MIELRITKYILYVRQSFTAAYVIWISCFYARTMFPSFPVISYITLNTIFYLFILSNATSIKHLL